MHGAAGHIPNTRVAGWLDTPNVSHRLYLGHCGLLVPQTFPEVDQPRLDGLEFGPKSLGRRLRLPCALFALDLFSSAAVPGRAQLGQRVHLALQLRQQLLKPRHKSRRRDLANIQGNLTFARPRHVERGQNISETRLAGHQPTRLGSLFMLKLTCTLVLPQGGAVASLLLIARPALNEFIGVRQ